MIKGGEMMMSIMMVPKCSKYYPCSRDMRANYTELVSSNNCNRRLSRGAHKEGDDMKWSCGQSLSINYPYVLCIVMYIHVYKLTINYPDFL